jgi:polyisoprenoid-binding protein YceI
MLKRIRTVIVLLAVAAAPLVAADTYTIDKTHSDVSFQIRHFASKVRGRFTDFEGTIQADPSKPETSSVAFTIKTASIDTGNADRDKHLRSADFFDAADHPELAFNSTRIEALDEETFRITGDLALHGVTNEVVLHADVQGTEIDPWGNERVGLEVTGQLSRGDYDMTFNQALGSGNMLVSDKVRLALDISAVKQA